MADLDHETIDFESAQALGDNYCMLVGKIYKLNCEECTVDVKINGDIQQDVPIFYHCQGENTALPTGSCAPKSFDMFYKDQEGILVLHNLTEGVENEYTVIGFQCNPTEGGVKECVNKYLVIYIHKKNAVYLRHGIVWDLARDKMAKGIKDIHGNEVIFPCDGDTLYYIERHSLGQRVSRLNTEGSNEVCDSPADYQTTSRILFQHADDRIFCGDCDEVGSGIDPWRCPENNLALRTASSGIIFECSGPDSDKPYFEAETYFNEDQSCHNCQVYRPSGEPYYIKYCTVQKDLYGVSNKAYFERYPHHTCEREIDTWWQGEDVKVKKGILTTYISCERYDMALATPDYADLIYWNRRLSMVFSVESPMGMMIIDGARDENVPVSYVPMGENIKSAIAGDSARYGDISPPGNWEDIPGLSYQSDSVFVQTGFEVYGGGGFKTDKFTGHGIDQFAGFTYIRQNGMADPEFCCFQVYLYYFVYRPYNFNCQYPSFCKEYTDVTKAKVHIQFKFERSDIYKDLIYNEETHHEELEKATEDLLAQHFDDWGWEKAAINMKMYHYKFFVESNGG